MNSSVLTDLMKRLRGIERTAARYRAGEITATSPLAVTLGGASAPYENVKAITDDLDIGDHVAVLVFGNDLLVLGRLR